MSDKYPRERRRDCRRSDPLETGMSSIWHYGSVGDLSLYMSVIDQTVCLYCSTPLLLDKDAINEAETYEMYNYGMSDKFTTTSKANIGICEVCGWWMYNVRTWIGGKGPASQELKVGVLRQLDLSNADVPLDEVRAYLAAKFDARFAINPRLFEEVVASVFRDHGFSTVVTNYSGDGGIDIILDRPPGGTIGVQVKRYKDRIAVNQIRELTGSLVIGGYTKGIFVTTSDFQSGARSVADISTARGYPIELVNAHAFYEALKIAQLNSVGDVLERKPWGEIYRPWRL
jgi:hypothetical protein